MSDIRPGTPEQQLAEGFAHHIARWAQQSKLPAATLDVLRQAAYRVSLATSTGDVCTRLGEMRPSGVDDDGVVRALLLGSNLVGTPNAPGAFPLILDGDGRLYLHRYFDYEQRLARHVMARGATPPDAAADARVATRLHVLFAANSAALDGRTDWQKIAAALAYAGTLTIISGGPGTGKTTTVVKLLACLLAENPECRIALAAPTGKAAARMLDAIRRQVDHLPPEVRSLLPTEAFTVHRLLGVTTEPGMFRHDAARPLAIDVLVVDEASMLDLALAAKLIEAVPAAARIILLGDKDQLAAVESGAVFAELCADPTLTAPCVARLAQLTGIASERIVTAPPLQPAPLRDRVVWLTENYRFEGTSGIGRLAEDIRNGDAGSVLDALREGPPSNVSWIADATAEPARSTLASIDEGYASYVAAVRDQHADPTAVFASFGRFRVLCAQREGARGVSGINDAISRSFRQSLVASPAFGPGSEWYVGRPVMVLRNDYVQKLFNGDVGIALPGAEGALMIFFPDAAAGFRTVAPVRLPAHETAFATTVHKAQGAEFEEVLLLLPAQHARGTTRELLYTAVTRARSRVTLAGSAEVLERAIASPTIRHSGLLARLREAAAERQ